MRPARHASVRRISWLHSEPVGADNTATTGVVKAHMRTRRPSRLIFATPAPIGGRHLSRLLTTVIPCRSLGVDPGETAIRRADVTLGC